MYACTLYVHRSLRQTPRSGGVGGYTDVQMHGRLKSSLPAKSRGTVLAFLHMLSRGTGDRYPPSSDSCVAPCLHFSTRGVRQVSEHIQLSKGGGTAWACIVWPARFDNFVYVLGGMFG